MANRNPSCGYKFLRQAPIPRICQPAPDGRPTYRLCAIGTQLMSRGNDRSAFLCRQLAVRKRDLNRHAIFVAYRPRDVALAGDVFDEIDAARAHQDLFATGYFQLAVAAERDDVLAPGGGVPIGDTSGRRATKLRTASRQQLIGAGFAERSE